MPTYISLHKATEQGVRTIKELPKRVRETMAQSQAQGITIKGWYATQGEYDYVTLVEAPDDETAMAAIIALNMQGNVRSTTLRAFSLEEMERILSKLPG